MPQLIHNGVNIDKIYHNGVEVKEVYHNGVKVFPDWIEVPNVWVNNNTMFPYVPRLVWKDYYKTNTVNLIDWDKRFFWTQLDNRNLYVCAIGGLDIHRTYAYIQNIQALKITFDILDYDNAGASANYFLFMHESSKFRMNVSPTVSTSTYGLNLVFPSGYAKFLHHSYEYAPNTPPPSNKSREWIVTKANPSVNGIDPIYIGIAITRANPNHMTPIGLKNLRIFYKL